MKGRPGGSIRRPAREDPDIGPADVTDSMYAFYAKGVGKVAEVEATRISALFIYHSKTKVAKILEAYPKRED